MPRIKLTVAYDGTNYCGWQVQPNGVSIQAVLQKAIENLLGKPTDVTGASRTDSGVHALGQVAVFDTDSRIPAWKYAMAINQRLPDDIVVQKSEIVPDDFHPRYQEVEKTYEYRILNRRTALPNERLYSWHYRQKLDTQAMQRAAALFIGTHDFGAFCSIKTSADSTVRAVYTSNITRSGDIITYRISGDGFLYNMVRIIMGALAKVGVGQRSDEDILRALQNPSVKFGTPTAPARGLTLVGIRYPETEEKTEKSARQAGEND